MSNKKNNLLFIKLAFQQAQINLGSTGSNPSVGCIIEKNGSVISSGFTKINGRPHAEAVSLQKNIKFDNANLYTTLEPCSHYGKTPPCVKQIINKKIRHVFISIFDCDHRSYKKSKKILNKYKIKVTTKQLVTYGKKFYQSYFLMHKKNKLPFIDSKISVTKDFYSKIKNSKWITNEHSRKRAHFLRSRYDCIVSTSKSINDDNSLLNCRIEGLEKKSPSLVIIDRNLKLKQNLKLFKKIKRKIYIFTASNKNKKKINFFKKLGIKIIHQKNLKNKDNLKFFYKKLKKMGFSRIFVESGLTYLNHLITNKIINNLYLFKTKQIAGKNGINYSTNNIIKKINYKKNINVNLFGDKLYKIKLK